MEIDRIDKNNIRVFLVHKDLEERGVTILDLLGNQMQVEKFFYSILEEVDTDHSFSGTQSITFQVMPNEDGLELLISKSPRDFENNLHAANKSSSNVNPSFNPETAAKSSNSGLEDDLSGFNTKEEILAGIKKYRQQRYLKALKPDSLIYVAQFDSIDDLIDLGRFLTMKVKTQLYLYREQYYVIFTLYKKDASQKKYTNLITSVNEYGNPATIAPELLAEHGQLLIKNSVFQTLAKYF